MDDSDDDVRQPVKIKTREITGDLTDTDSDIERKGSRSDPRRKRKETT